MVATAVHSNQFAKISLASTHSEPSIDRYYLIPKLYNWVTRINICILYYIVTLDLVYKNIKTSLASHFNLFEQAELPEMLFYACIQVERGSQRIKMTFPPTFSLNFLASPPNNSKERDDYFLQTA